MVAEGGDVLHEGLEAALHLRLHRLLARAAEEAQDAAYGDETFPRPAHQPLVAPQALERHLEPVARPPLVLGEDLAGEFGHPLLHLFENVGEAIDNRVKQADECHLARLVARPRLRRLGCEHAEGLRLRMAKGDEAMTREDEGHGHAVGDFGVRAMDQDRRHEEGALFLIEPARRLDLPHFLERRQIEAEGAFNPRDLLRLGVQKIDPDGVLRQRGVAGRGLRQKRSVLADIGGDHAPLPHGRARRRPGNAGIFPFVRAGAPS